MGLINFKSILSYFTEALTPYLLHQFFKRGHLALWGLFFFSSSSPHPGKYSNHNIFTRKEWQHLNLLQHSVRVARGGQAGLAREGCAVRAAGTAIHSLLHLQGNVRSWQKGSTPRHYFRHNIRPMHTIKQWQHLNSHRTSTYPLSLNNESEEEATFFFLALRTTYRNNGNENVIHIWRVFLGRTTCVFTAFVQSWYLVEAITGVRSPRGQVNFQEKGPPYPRRTARQQLFKMEPRPLYKWLNYSV